jgi:hypothetical protein
MIDLSNRRDRKEVLEMVELYFIDSLMRCPGGYIINSMYVCSRCDSEDPDNRCDIRKKKKN